MADQTINSLPPLADVSGALFYATKGGVDYSVTTAAIQGSVSPQSQNTVYAGPPTAPGDFPSFRSLVIADIPDLSSFYVAATGGTISSATISGSTINGGTLNIVGVGASALFEDDKFAIRDQSDTTKRMAFSVGSVATGTTRTITIPDADFVMVGDTTTQALTNKTIRTVASTGPASGFRMPHGSAPTSPVNGDMWTTTAGLYAQINNATVGPFAASAGSVVNTFNGRVGTVTLLSADVTSALGFTPYNPATGSYLLKAGDTMGGVLNMGSNQISAVSSILTPDVSLAATGTIRISPDGIGSTAGRLTLPAVGSATLNNSLNVVNGLSSGATITALQNLTSSSVNVVLAPTGAGTVYLRPNGFGSTTGQMTVDSGGHVAVANGGGMDFGTTVTTGTDLSKHIALYSTSYGMNVISGFLQLVVGGVVHKFATTSYTSPGTVSDSSGNVRAMVATTANATTTLLTAHLNGSVEKTNTSAYTYTIAPSLGAQGNAITIVNSGTAGNITLVRGVAVALYRNGVDADITISPGSMATIYRSATANRWITA